VYHIKGKTWVRIRASQAFKEFKQGVLERLPPELRGEVPERLPCWKCERDLLPKDEWLFRCTEPHTYAYGRYILCERCARKYIMVPMGNGLYKTVDLVRPNFWRMAEVLSEYEGIEKPEVKLLLGREWKAYLDKHFPPRKTVTIEPEYGVTITQTRIYGGAYERPIKRIVLCGVSRLKEFLHEFYHHYCNVKGKIETQEEYERKLKEWKKVLRNISKLLGGELWRRR